MDSVSVAAADCEVNLAVVCYLPFSLARSLTKIAPKDSHLPNPPEFKTHPAYTSQPTSCRACLISVTHTPAAGNPGLPAHRRASCVCESLTHWNGVGQRSGNVGGGRRAGFTHRGFPKEGSYLHDEVHSTGVGRKITCQAALGATAAAARQHRNPQTHVVLVTRRHVSSNPAGPAPPNRPKRMRREGKDGICSSQVSSDDRKSAGKRIALRARCVGPRSGTKVCSRVAHLGVQSWPRFPSPFLGQAQPFTPPCHGPECVAALEAAIKQRGQRGRLRFTFLRMHRSGVGSLPAWPDVEG